MERRHTHRGVSTWKLVVGIAMLGYALLHSLVIARAQWTLLSLLDFRSPGLFLLIGVGLIIDSQRGHACARCDRILNRREYALSPSVAGPLREAVENEDSAALAAIVRGPRIDTQVPARTTLVLHYCAKCKSVATIEAAEARGGTKAIAERELAGKGVEPLAQAGIDVMP